MNEDVYELGFKLGKSGVFSSTQIIQIQNLFFQACNTDKLLHMILAACMSQKLTVCDSLRNNLYDLEVKSNFLIGLLNGNVSK
ncbi:hypothetical protein QEW_4465 [Clostridioides difficile CD160]|uniref:hypothetical protein n=1 Tax=unclassified Clostridioides TaxID=2635829 RepID=UPI00038D7C1F|nr:hypothetical protein QEW_4465 [Clostridioides difficile CD160]